MTSPDYDFTDLSPYDFEALLRDLLSAHEGIAFSTYRIGPDGGIDLQARTDSAVVIAQCKHTPQASRAKLISLAAQEMGKSQNFEAEISRYIFITSADITPKTEREIREELTDLAPTVEVHGRGWINALLAMHPDLERRHFKLWLKSSVAIREMLSGGVFLRGESRARRIEENYLRFVHHDICDRAEKSLEVNGIAILQGAPGAGKTAAAEYLILQWWRRGFRVIVDPRTVDNWWSWLADETPTVFFFDDAWGQTRLHDHSSSHHEKDFAEFLASIIQENLRGDRSRVRTKVAVVTSRSLVLHDTRRYSDATNTLLEAVSDALIPVGRLPHDVKSRILFNHVNIAIDNDPVRAQLASYDWWTTTAAHPNYSPRIVEIVTKRRRFESGAQLVAELREALDDPQQIWQSSFDSFSSLEQLLLLILAVSDSQGVERDAVTLRLRDHSLTEISNTIRRLSGNWIERSNEKGTEVYALSDPSQRDFLVRHVARESLACLDLIKHSHSYKDVAALCEQGRPSELEYQPSLFSLEEASLRESLDACTHPLLNSLRAHWASAIKRLESVPRGFLTVPTQAFVDLFTMFIEIVAYHSDRYSGRGWASFNHDGWTESAMRVISALLDDTDMGSFEETLEAVWQIHGTYSKVTRYRVFEGPYQDHMQWIRDTLMMAWYEWDRVGVETFGEARYWSDLAEAVIDDPGFFRAVGFHEGAASVLEDIESFDAEVSFQIESDTHTQDWVAKVEELEELFDCTLQDSRRTLRLRGLLPEKSLAFYAQETAAPDGLPGIDGKGEYRASGTIDALFRSLGKGVHED
ncbi:hypothetical protein CG723_20630 [Streptomyces sp. CB01635]|uniref:nSTAND3 domain-containing NTPase n=1 Tax=unclassified Streptomyces TaxID=2593676 RepID=UPI000C26DD5B|nr:restriction endonuclease [Streptomyces sp. CB01635]PJN10110.1 hypothetical protein CG723_20630 [Streptomyces sp. CB01635]